MSAVLSPASQADLAIERMSRSGDYNHGARLMRISKTIAHDPVRLAGAIRNAEAEHMYEFCCALVRVHSDFDGDVTDLVQALSLICNTAAKDEA